MDTETKNANVAGLPYLTTEEKKIQSNADTSVLKQ